MKRAVLAWTIAAAAACSQPVANAPTQLNLDRPVDISFACYGGLRLTGGRAMPSATDEVVQSAQPALSCEKRSEPLIDDRGMPTPQHRAPGQEEVSGLATVGLAEWFGFILQSARGTVAISHWATKPPADVVAGDVQVLDADPLTPGKNSISIGEEPIAIATDAAGCFEVTANAGSCDLSTLEVNSAVDNHKLDALTTILDASTPVQVKRVQVKNSAGVPIRSRPAAMVSQPTTTIVGNACPATASGLIYLAYPSCHLVAAVDPGTGMMLRAIKFDATGARVTAGDDLCPNECADDMGKLDVVRPGIRPVALAVQSGNDRTRLAIGADNAASFAIVDLDPLMGPVGMVTQIPLEDRTGGKLGITAIALSPQIGLGGADELLHDDRPLINRGQYIYGVATDNTVRVADVLNVGRECDTQIDSRFLRSVRNVDQLQCLPLGDPNFPRRSGARGPGIELIGDGVPTSVSFFTAPPVFDPRVTGSIDPRSGPNRIIGHFGLISASSGLTYIVNVNDVGTMPFEPNNANKRLPDDLFAPQSPQATSPVILIAHQLRNNAAKLDAVGTPATAAAEDRGVQSCTDAGPSGDVAGGGIGGPRLTAPPLQSLTPGPQTVSPAKLGELPSLRQFRCGTEADAVAVSEMQLQADLQTRDKVFPDLRSLVGDETWTMTWEGLLSSDTPTSVIDGPPIRDGQIAVDALGMYLRDPGHPFCEVGAEPFDIVQLRGCNPGNGNGDCPAGYTCFVHPQLVVPDGEAAVGACMLTSEADRLATACRDFLTTRRRYTIGAMTSGQLTLLPRKHELRTTPIDGCTSDEQCSQLANYALQTSTAGQPFAVANLTDPHQWKCMPDPARAPINPDPAKNLRCVQSCDAAHACDVGSICQAGTCMEGVIPPPACVTGPQRYDVRASEAFSLIGNRSGYVHPWITDSTGNCVRDPQASTQQIGRIPLKAPACDPAADPITGKLPSGGVEPNPCSTTVPAAVLETTPVDATPPGDGNACAGAKSTIVEKPRPAIQFRNRAFRIRLVEPTYPGDAKCIGDRAGTLTGIPLVFPGYQIAFHQTGGYSPMILPAITPVFPVKVVSGPTNSIWVVDDGDFLSTTFGVPSTRGRVYRIESTNIFGVNLLQ